MAGEALLSGFIEADVGGARAIEGVGLGGHHVVPERVLGFVRLAVRSVTGQTDLVVQDGVGSKHKVHVVQGVLDGARRHGRRRLPSQRPRARWRRRSVSGGRVS